MPSASQHKPYRIVQSRQNGRVKELRSSFASAVVTANGRVGIEGEHLLGEALRSGLRVSTVFFRSGDEALLDRLALPATVEIIELPKEIFAGAMTTESPQGIAALVEAPTFSPEHIFGLDAPLMVVAAGLQDPGNLGTLIRSAEAFGAAAVLALPGTVGVWNAKALRASSGSAFRLPVISMDEGELFSLLRSRGIRALAATAELGAAATATDLTGGVALLIGNEGRGLSPEILARADGRITIPCPGPVESLNAGVAGSILLYEAARQRSVVTAAGESAAANAAAHPKLQK